MKLACDTCTFSSLFRPPLCLHPLLCWPLWRCQWSCECQCELDTEWWRQCWFLPHQHYHQRSPDPIWGTSEHYHCQCRTNWFHGRIWIQHHSTWCQLWESGGKGEWASDNHPSRWAVWTTVLSACVVISIRIYSATNTYFWLHMRTVHLWKCNTHFICTYM